jgi:hypothetical protein
MSHAMAALEITYLNGADIEALAPVSEEREHAWPTGADTGVPIRPLDPLGHATKLRSELSDVRAAARNNRKEGVMKRQLEDFKALPPARQVVLSVLLAVALALVAAAERDIQRRPADQVRGSKALWRLVCLNALGAVGYFSWGRRRPPT